MDLQSITDAVIQSEKIGLVGLLFVFNLLCMGNQLRTSIEYRRDREKLRAELASCQQQHIELLMSFVLINQQELPKPKPQQDKNDG